MVRCSFCKGEIEKGTGLTVVVPPGKVENYCSSKCEKNALKLKRNPRKVKWIQKGNKSK